ncbi:MAG TPA: ArsA-related P-loop ATPase [Acidimicrobiales bacterium]|nr:ArsA-related P-loop ATPase [Acidimicrobiales bacterium]
MTQIPKFGQLLATKEIVVVCGPGGVGKTTLAASIAVAAAADSRRRVLVLTVDPARRLADALGIAGIGNEATEIRASAFAGEGITTKGTLFAAMLDVKASWDALVGRYAPDRAAAETILASPLYRDLTARFPGSAEYIAMERLHEIHAEGGFDLIVVDTPPGARALDLFDAPERLGEFFSSRLLRWLTVPARSRLGGAASKAFSHVAERILGSGFLEEIRTLFVLLGAMQEGFVDRARQVSGLLHSEETTFCVVATPEMTPVHEASRLLDALGERSLHLGLLIANRVLPKGFTDLDAIAYADDLVARGGAVGRATIDCSDLPGDLVDAVLREAGQSFANFSEAAQREEEMIAELADRLVPPVTIGDEMDDVVDLGRLAAIGRRILSAPTVPRHGVGART